MISIKTAKALKSAGLAWEPKRGDWFYNHHGYVFPATLDCVRKDDVAALSEVIKDYDNRTLQFAPRLDQLLVEIEARGWEYQLTKIDTDTAYSMRIKQYKFMGPYQWERFHADTRDEAAAQALLWILKEGAK